MLILVNGITSSMFDYSSTILDTNKLPIKFKNYIESLPNGFTAVHFKVMKSY